jgi:hypothetical protein
MPEPRYRDFQVLGQIMAAGPQTIDEIIDGLYPGGTPSRSTGVLVPKDPKSIRAKLDVLMQPPARIRVAEGNRYEVHPDLGRVWVIYVGSERGYVGVYDGSLLPLPTRDRSGTELDILDDIGEANWRDSHQHVLNPCLEALAQRVLAVDEPPRLPGALVIALPAALSLDNRRVQGEAPEEWTSPHVLPIDEIVSRKWRSLRRQKPTLPDLPRFEGRLALTSDTDIVLDTLGAMYDLSQIGATRPAPRRARVVLGVKHSVAIRSTVITRGPEDLHLGGQRRRVPGQRRDAIYRGAFGQTVGLGHSIALIQRASRKTRDGADVSVSWEDSAQYHAELHRDRRPCICGTVDPPHLNQVASYQAVTERLRKAGLSVERGDVWDGINRQIELETEEGHRARLILEETGRLLAYALDNGLGLYDPEAILVTGKMAFNHTFWQTVKEAAVAARAEHRCLVRAADISGDDVSRPIGPRGAAWLGFDTWVFPALLRRLEMRP